jgi:biopolymer transport protein ExbD
MKIRKRKHYVAAELDITAFMNLMIVLVPVLLLSLVFSQVSAIEINLPLAGGESAVEDQTPGPVELLIRHDYLQVDYPQGVMLKRIPRTEAGEYDFALLSVVLQEVKRRLREQGIDSGAITLLSEDDVDYQTIISTLDTVRSFKALVVTSVVDAALFPEVSFGDAPLLADGGAQ